MKDFLRVLQWQRIVSPDVEKNLKSAETGCCRAKELGADLLALPEMFCCPYEAKNFPLYAEPERGRIWSCCASLAAKYGLLLSAGSMPERGADGNIYNTAYVFGPNGQQLAKHRKMHLFDIDVPGGQRFFESETLCAGDTVTVFPTEFGPMGLCVCYDARFPELGRLMALRGARLLLVPASFNHTTGPLHWELTLRAQAMFNQFFVTGTAAALDSGASYASWGHSLAADPWGRVLAQLESGEGEQIVDINLCESDRVRQQIPLLRHRRTDAYELREKKETCREIENYQ